MLSQRGCSSENRDIDLEDKATLAPLAAEIPRGIFPFEQPGAIRLLKRKGSARKSLLKKVVYDIPNRPGAE